MNKIKAVIDRLEYFGLRHCVGPWTTRCDNHPKEIHRWCSTCIEREGANLLRELTGIPSKRRCEECT